MIKNERHTQILQILSDEGYADVNYLSKVLYASCPTIRRDLTLLEKDGYISRNHGGAILNKDKLHNNPLNFRRDVRNQEKANICKLASTLISKGNLIFIDDSSTAYHLAKYIKDIEDLTVVTNGFAICNELLANNINTISTGGRLVKKSQAFVGMLAQQTANSFNADIMFFSSAALDDEGIISDYSEEESSLRKTMAARSKKIAFLCDSDKFHTSSELRLFSLKNIDYIITDQPLEEKLVKLCELEIMTETKDAILYRHISKR